MSSAKPPLVGERYAIEWDLEKFPPLGKGSFGVVFKVRDTVLETDSALKRMPAVYDSFDDTKRVLRELRLLRLMQHDSILGISDAFLEANEKDSVFFTTQIFESDLSLTTKKMELYNRIASPPILISIIRQVLEGIKYLHSVGIVHRDIKPANILIDYYTVQIKICDFGLARTLPFRSAAVKTVSPITEYVNTRWYRAPEVTLSNGQYGIEQDVWAAGCTFVDLIFRQPLFPGKSCLKQLTLIIDMLGTPDKPENLAFTMTVPAMRYLCSLPSTKGSGLMKFFKARWSGLLIDFSETFREYFFFLLSGMLKFDTKHRTSASDALSSPLFDPDFSNARCYPIDVGNKEPKKPLLPFDFRDIERCSVAQYPANFRQIMQQEVNLIHLQFLASKSEACENLPISPVSVIEFPGSPSPPPNSLCDPAVDRPRRRNVKHPTPPEISTTVLDRIPQRSEIRGMSHDAGDERKEQHEEDPYEINGRSYQLSHSSSDGGTASVGGIDNVELDISQLIARVECLKVCVQSPDLTTAEGSKSSSTSPTPMLYGTNRENSRRRRLADFISNVLWCRGSSGHTSPVRKGDSSCGKKISPRWSNTRSHMDDDLGSMEDGSCETIPELGQFSSSRTLP